MSLTAFQRIRRMKQIEEMKPENIEQPKEEKEIVEQPKEEIVEQPRITSRRRKN